MPAKYSNSKETDQTASTGADTALQQSVQTGSGETTPKPSLPEEIRKRLNNKLPVTVAFPPCSGEMLALIKTTDEKNKDEITQFFDEYFKFGAPHVIIEGDLSAVMDKKLLNCGDASVGTISRRNGQDFFNDCCLCSPCLTLDGNRNAPTELPRETLRIKRLFIGDLVWLFYFERMGVFQILGAILDAYASNGRLPISNGPFDGNVKDGIIALVLEVMTRQTKMGMSSTVRDRGASYQTALGWTTDAARKLNLNTQVNTGFNTLFHKFIFNALEFYKDKRLAIAIQGAGASVARPSVATLTTISDTLEVLIKRFEPFDYGRNYHKTLGGVIWLIAGMAVIRDLRTTLGIPPAYGDPHEFIPAAYDLLVLKRPVTSGDTNRYIVHKECARNGRDILIDLEVINHRDTSAKDGELEKWLERIEPKVEAYRTAYRSLTGVDLGASQNPTIEQQV